MTKFSRTAMGYRYLIVIPIVLKDDPDWLCLSNEAIALFLLPPTLYDDDDDSTQCPLAFTCKLRLTSSDKDEESSLILLLLFLFLFSCEFLTFLACYSKYKK